MPIAPLKLSRSAHGKLLKLVKQIQAKQRDFTTFYDRLEAIDKSYAKSTVDIAPTTDCSGANSTLVTNKAIKVPIVNSEVDSVVAFLTKLFVNRSPLFPVIGDSTNPSAALELQALISKDARQQRYGRQLLRFLATTARYNVGAIEIEASSQKDFNFSSVEIEKETRVAAQYEPVVKLLALDMYNAIFDYRVPPADIAMEGEYAGYNKIVSRSWLKALGITRSDEGIAYNLREAYSSSMSSIGDIYRVPPDVGDTKGPAPSDKEDWFDWLGITDRRDLKLPKSSYLYTKLYVRLIPGDLDLNHFPNPAHPRIVRLEVINDTWLISYKEIITPLDSLPILFSDMREDGFEYQTKSIGEGVTPFQDIATELLHVRLEGSKRALSDRAIYDTDYLDSLDVNAPTAAAKIPLKKSLRNAGDKPRISDTYYQIPFEGQGVVNALADLNTVMQLKDQVNGVGMGMRGEHRKGNRTRGEFETVEGGSDAKGMPYAIRIEEQVMIPLRLMIKFFILFSDKVEREILDEESGEKLEINIAALRQAMLGFRITGGLRPKAALKDPAAFSTALQFTQNNPELNQEYSVSGIFAEMLALWDIDISKHKRKEIPNAGNNAADSNPPIQPQGADTGDGGAN